MDNVEELEMAFEESIIKGNISVRHTKLDINGRWRKRYRKAKKKAIRLDGCKKEFAITGFLFNNQDKDLFTSTHLSSY